MVPRLFDPQPGANPLTVRAVVELYLRHCQSETLHSPDAEIDRHRVLSEFADALAHISAAECKPFHLIEWISAHPGWKSPSTRRTKANCVKACFSWAARIERIDRNPFVNVRYAESERRPEMPDAVLADLIRAAHPRFADALRFLRFTACRLGELCAAKWPDFDLIRGEWTIHKHKGRRFTGRSKQVALVPEAVELLASVAWANGGSGIAFVNDAGTAWTRKTLGQQFRRTKKRIGLQTDASLHGIRHRALSAIIAATGSVKFASEQAGHHSSAITEKYYWHRTPEQLDAIRAAVRLGLPK